MRRGGHRISRYIIVGICKSSIATIEYKASILDNKDIPGGELILQKLQGTLSIEKKVFSSAAEAMKTVMRNLLIKKLYSADKREYRKRGRNDRKNKHRCPICQLVAPFSMWINA
ncbi:hypothetical protein ACH5RR_006734 [Cinchona calisaya]|uniref:Uncharacterized protein n=1 Tax=Cinchona calisaya TaxID=153742 RepID=A0ABD3APU2_9GENT